MNRIKNWIKWPNSITFIRHGESAYNILKAKKEADPLYQEFKKVFNRDYKSKQAKDLAFRVWRKFALNVSDYDTPLTEAGWSQSIKTGERLGEIIEKPDAILCSPYIRTRKTLEGIGKGWGIDVSRAVMERRIREQEHGLALLYNDWRVFSVFHPEQKELRDLLGPYSYQYPQGESVPMVQDRIQSITETMIREYVGGNLLVISHHLTTLSVRANFERLSPEQFIELDEKEKPANCGVTLYRCNPVRGKNGKLELVFYNKKLY